MVQLIGYTIVNGVQARNYQYRAEVKSQEEIEEKRKELIKKYTIEKTERRGYFDEELDSFQVIFTTRTSPNSQITLKG